MVIAAELNLLFLDGRDRFARIKGRRDAVVYKNIRRNLPKNVISSKIPKNATFRQVRHYKDIKLFNDALTHFVRIKTTCFADVPNMKSLQRQIVRI
jgi:hypothetical protein